MYVPACYYQPLTQVLYSAVCLACSFAIDTASHTAPSFGQSAVQTMQVYHPHDSHRHGSCTQLAAPDLCTWLADGMYGQGDMGGGMGGGMGGRGMGGGGRRMDDFVEGKLFLGDGAATCCNASVVPPQHLVAADCGDLNNSACNSLSDVHSFCHKVTWVLNCLSVQVAWMPTHHRRN